jgi:hypothetical protein
MPVACEHLKFPTLASSQNLVSNIICDQKLSAWQKCERPRRARLNG